MSKGLTFILGVLLGGGVGAGITAYILKDRYEQEACDMIDEYHDRCQDRIEQIMQAYGVRDEDIAKLNESSDSDDETEDKAADPRDDVSNNEGVKKYHHYVAPTELKGTDDMTKGQEDVNKYPKIDDCPDYIEEISDEEFSVDEKKYDNVYLTYDFNTDRLLLNPDTEDEIDAEEQYHVSRSELIGNMWKWSTDYISEEDGTGAFYARNNRLMKDFEVIVRYDPNQEVVEVN